MSNFLANPVSEWERRHKMYVDDYRAHMLADVQERLSKRPNRSIFASPQQPQKLAIEYNTPQLQHDFSAKSISVQPQSNPYSTIFTQQQPIQPKFSLDDFQKPPQNSPPPPPEKQIKRKVSQIDTNDFFIPSEEKLKQKRIQEMNEMRQSQLQQIQEHERSKKEWRARKIEEDLKEEARIRKELEKLNLEYRKEIGEYEEEPSEKSEEEQVKTRQKPRSFIDEDSYLSKPEPSLRFGQHSTKNFGTSHFYQNSFTSPEPIKGYAHYENNTSKLQSLIQNLKQEAQEMTKEREVAVKELDKIKAEIRMRTIDDENRYKLAFNRLPMYSNPYYSPYTGYHSQTMPKENRFASVGYNVIQGGLNNYNNYAGDYSGLNQHYVSSTMKNPQSKFERVFYGTGDQYGGRMSRSIFSRDKTVGYSDFEGIRQRYSTISGKKQKNDELGSTSEMILNQSAFVGNVSQAQEEYEDEVYQGAPGGIGVDEEPDIPEEPVNPYAQFAGGHPEEHFEVGDLEPMHDEEGGLQELEF